MQEKKPFNVHKWKEIRAIIEQARKEVEGDELVLKVNGRIDVEATISMVMKNSVIMQDLTVIQMVMSRVCQRIGVPSCRYE